MAPVSDVEREGDGSRSLSREDCLCPICLEIFMEPVTLPCTHTFCKVCFLESVDKATLCCPLCRKRVSVWARQHGRTKTLVNEALWRRVQAAFPRQKLQEEAHEPVCFPRLSEPGAVRREYEDQLSKLTAEKAALEEQQSRASEELIQKLLAEEEQLQMEQQQRHQEDEALARLLSQELNPVPDLSQTPEPSAEKKRPTGIDRFLFPLSRSPAHSSTSNKENMASDPPPLDTGQSQPREPHTGQSQPREAHTGQSQPREAHTGQSQPEGMDQSQLVDRPAEGGVKRKSSSQEEEESQGKRSCQSSSLPGVATGEWEAELQRRRKQEEEDLRVALKLQRQLDRQQPRTDRRKGSDDAYELRAPPRAQATPTCRRVSASSATLNRASASSTATLNRASASTATLNRASASSTATLNRASSEPLSPKASAPSALAPPTTQPKTRQTPPHTPKTRQTTLTDLFNLQ